MNIIEAKQAAIERGFTHVKTHGGLVPILDWTPYGGYNSIVLTWDCNLDNTMYDVSGGSVNGIWRFSKEG